MPATTDLTEMDVSSGPNTWSFTVERDLEELRLARDRIFGGIYNSCLTTTTMAEANKKPAAESESSGRQEVVDLTKEPESGTLGGQEAAGHPLELIYKACRAPDLEILDETSSDGPACIPGVPQHKLYAPTLHLRLVEAKYLLQQEMQMRLMAQLDTAAARSEHLEIDMKLQNECRLRLQCEEKLQSLKNLRSQVSLTELQVSTQINELMEQLQVQKLQTDLLKQQLEEVSLQLKERVSRGSELVNELRGQNQALAKELEEEKHLHRQSEEVTAAQLEELKKQLQEKNSYNLQLTSTQNVERKVTCTLPKKVYDPQQEMMDLTTPSPLPEELHPRETTVHLTEDNTPEELASKKNGERKVTCTLTKKVCDLQQEMMDLTTSAPLTEDLHPRETTVHPTEDNAPEELASRQNGERKVTRTRPKTAYELQQEMMDLITPAPLPEDLHPRETTVHPTEEVSLWRRFKKSITPKRLRKYKDQE